MSYKDFEASFIPGGRDNYFLIRVKGLHPTSGLPFVPEVVCRVNGFFEYSDGGVGREKCFYNTQCKLEQLEWHELP